jgi:excisionase family DNA binding protein
MTRQWLTVQQVAHRLQVAEESVRRWLRAGELGGVNLGGKGGWRISEEDFDRFLRERRAKRQSRGEDHVE